MGPLQQPARDSVSTGLSTRARAKHLSATYQALDGDSILRCKAASAFPSWVLTLPPVGPAMGQMLIISAESIANSATITIEDYHDDATNWTDQVLAVTGEYIVIISNGVQWCLLVETIA